jgi:hypothetical protein
VLNGPALSGDGMLGIGGLVGIELLVDGGIATATA